MTRLLEIETCYYDPKEKFRLIPNQQSNQI